MVTWGVRAGLVVIAVQPLVTTLLLWLVDGTVSRGTVLGAVACSVIQAVLLLWIQKAAETTDELAKATHKEVREAAEHDYVADFEAKLHDGL